jgi:NAD(P)-dependent dehydrogenase (short-subunit alcohol dehydrogenase family)
VRVNGISPGPIADTEGMKRLAPDAEAEREVVRHIPLLRLGSVDDIGNAALFLCSPMAGYVTGTIFDIEGGFQLGDAAADCLTPTR